MRYPVFLLLCLVLAGCGEASKTYSYTPPSTPGGRLCAGQCLEAQDFCHEACDLKQRTCIADVQSRAIEDYDKYTREQFINHQDIDLLPRDFERLGPCNEIHDGCYARCGSDYGACYGNCGGKINVTTSCQFMCF